MTRLRRALRGQSANSKSTANIQKRFDKKRRSMVPRVSELADMGSHGCSHRANPKEWRTFLREGSNSTNERANRA